MGAPLLSICIATFRRADFLAQTLDSILGQWRDGVELVVVDGASPDETPEILARYTERYPFIVYRREPTNSGVDRDFDKAVGYASGRYCWLMSDDDLLAEGALARVLHELRDESLELLVLNTEVRNRDLTVQLMSRRAPLDSDRDYAASDSERLFAESCLHLSFIAATVIRRDIWMTREREKYYGTFFIHIGVMFQAPLRQARFLAAPLVIMRDGNAMWTPRAFDIWMRRWPALVWSFDSFSEAARRSITARFPARNPKMLAWLRGLGGYGKSEYDSDLREHLRPAARMLARILARVPVRLANAVNATYCAVRGGPDRRMKMYSLVTAGSASAWARWLASRQRVPLR